jgi:uncharacterized integral membrane protein
MKNATALIASVTILLLTVIFTLQNAEAAELKVLFWNTEASLSLILFITLAIGVLSAIIAFSPLVFSLRATKIELKKNIEKLETSNQLNKQSVSEKPKE